MLEAESAIAMQGKYIPGVGASGGGRPTPYDRRGRGMRGMRGVGGASRGRGAGNIKGMMGMYMQCLNLLQSVRIASFIATTCVTK